MFESGRGRFAGRDAIVGNMANVNRALGATRKERHLTTNVSIEPQGDRATGTAEIIDRVGCEGKTELTAFGIDHDELRKATGAGFSPPAARRSKASRRGRQPCARITLRDLRRYDSADGA